MDILDLMEDGEDLNEGVKSFFKVLKSGKEGEIHNWLKQVKDTLLHGSRSRTMQQRANLVAYRGISTHKYDKRREYNNVRRFNKVNKFIINHLFDLTETKVSQLMRISPAVEVLPANAEYTDRASAKVVDLLMKHIWYTNSIDQLYQEYHRQKAIFGEAYMFNLWDKDKGDLHPMWVEARNKGLKTIQLDGDTAFDLNKPLMIGDVKYELELPWRVLLQQKQKIDDVDYCIRITTKPTDELLEEYPNKKDEIESTDDLRIFDIESMDDRFLEKHTVVYEFYHRYTKFVDKGSYIKFTDKGILEKEELPFTHGELPFVRITDLDVPGMLHGVSRYETVLPMQNMYNNLSTLIAKNIYLTAHAKWMMPRGACKIEQLGNDNTVVQYQGPVAPHLASVNPNPSEVYGFREGLKQDMQVVYGSHGISRGEVPKGITATSALQFLNELESERATTDIAKHSTSIKNNARMTIAVCGDYYDVNDGRLLRIVGRDNEYLIKHFDAANLNKDYDIRVNNSTGLPELKSSKMQRVLDTMQRNPTLFSAERWEELLELGNTERMHKLSTEAVKAADSENEDLLAGKMVGLPEEWEDHLVHWDSHSRMMQARSYKEETPDQIHAAIKQHVYWTEELMIEKSKTNPLFQAKLAQYKLFPIFFHESFQTPMSEEHQAAVVQGAANKEGKSMSGAIPGKDIEDKENK